MLWRHKKNKSHVLPHNQSPPLAHGAGAWLLYLAARSQKAVLVSADRRSRKFQLTLVSAKGIYSKPKCMQRPDSPAQWKVPSFSKASSPLAVKKVEGVEGMGNQAWPDLSELTGRNHQVPQRGGQDFGSTDQSCRAPWPELHLQSDSQQSMS